jgi:hypothetical protein
VGIAIKIIIKLIWSKKLKILLLAMMLLSIGKVVVAETWEYYSPGKLENFNIRYTAYDNDKTIYFSIFDDKIYKFNTETHIYKEISDIGTGLEDIALDKNNNLWMIHAGSQYSTTMGLYKYDGEKVISMNHILPDSINKNFLYSRFEKTLDGDIFISRGYFLYFIKDDKLIKVFDIRSAGFEDFLIDYRCNITFMNDYLIVSFSNTKDASISLNFIELNNVNDNKTYQFKDYDLPEKIYANKLIVHKNKLFMLMKEILMDSDFKKQKSYMYVFENGEIKKLFDIPHVFPHINDIILDNEDRLIVSYDYYKEDPYYSEIVYYDIEGQKIRSYITPKFNSDQPSADTTKKYQINGAGKFSLIEDNSIFMHPERFLGFFKFAPLPVSVESEINASLHGSSVWIFNVYPNPVENMTTLDFFCLPSHIDELSVEIYDLLGNKYSNFSHSILNYNYSNGKGQLQLSLKSVYGGVKYLVLKANGETFIKGIMVKS